MLKHSLFTLEHRGLDSSHPSCLDYQSQLLHTDTGKKQALEAIQLLRMQMGSVWAMGQKMKFGNFSELGGCSVDNLHSKAVQKPGTPIVITLAKDVHKL